MVSSVVYKLVNNAFECILIRKLVTSEFCFAVTIFFVISVSMLTIHLAFFFFVYCPKVPAGWLRTEEMFQISTFNHFCTVITKLGPQGKHFFLSSYQHSVLLYIAISKNRRK